MAKDAPPTVPDTQGYYFPEFNRTVEAKSYDEALKKVQKEVADEVTNG